MNRSSFRLIFTISILILVSSACGGGEKAVDMSTQPSLPPTQVATPTSPLATQADLGELLRQEEGGFTYRTATGYDVSAGLGIVSMLAEGADPDLGPSISLIGGHPEPGVTAQSLYEQLRESEDTQLSEPTLEKIGGFDGLVADIVISRNEIKLYGQIALVVTPENQFIALAAAPWERWESELQPIFSQILSSITFFTPTAVLKPTKTPVPEPTQTPEAVAEDQNVQLRQWAASAIASSQYADSGWDASQATGEPDVAACADDSRAWASKDFDTVEWLEVSFDKPVRPVQVNIYETYNAGQTVKVELLDVNGNYHIVYTAAPQVKECRMLSIDISSARYQVTSVRITVDQSMVGSWAEIDAVELVGYE